MQRQSLSLSFFFQQRTLTQTPLSSLPLLQVDWLTEAMQKRDFTVSAMHGDMDQRERDILGPIV